MPATAKNTTTTTATTTNTTFCCGCQAAKGTDSKVSEWVSEFFCGDGSGNPNPGPAHIPNDRIHEYMDERGIIVGAYRDPWDGLWYQLSPTRSS